MLIKRLVIGFAVAILAVGLLGGCNREKDDKPPVVPEQQQDS